MTGGRDAEENDDEKNAEQHRRFEPRRVRRGIEMEHLGGTSPVEKEGEKKENNEKGGERRGCLEEVLRIHHRHFDEDAEDRDRRGEQDDNGGGRDLSSVRAGKAGGGHGRRGARDKTAEDTAEQRADSCPGEAVGEIAPESDPDDEHHHQPGLERIENIEGSVGPVR